VRLYFFFDIFTVFRYDIFVHVYQVFLSYFPITLACLPSTLLLVLFPTSLWEYSVKNQNILWFIESQKGSSSLGRFNYYSRIMLIPIIKKKIRGSASYIMCLFEIVSNLTWVSYNTKNRFIDVPGHWLLWRFVCKSRRWHWRNNVT
jgi:hypothetical protein